MYCEAHNQERVSVISLALSWKCERGRDAKKK